jgi:hypothetical protein
MGISDELERLAKLRASGDLTEDDYEAAKSRVIREAPETERPVVKESRASRWASVVLLGLLLGALLLAIGAYAGANPNVNIPVISPLVCDIKGYTWHEGGLEGTGCYSNDF